MSIRQRRQQMLRVGQTGAAALLLFVVTFAQGVQAEPERPALLADSRAVYTSFSGDSGTVVQVSSGSFQVDTQRPVTFCGEWGAVTIPQGQVVVEVGRSTLEVTVLRGTASVDSSYARTGLVVLVEGDSRSWAEPDPLLTSLGMSE